MLAPPRSQTQISRNGRWRAKDRAPLNTDARSRPFRAARTGPDRAITAVIPSMLSRTEPIPYDKHVYKERHLVERFINKIKHFRRVATRYDKTAVAFLSFVAVAAFMVWLR